MRQFFKKQITVLTIAIATIATAFGQNIPTLEMNEATPPTAAGFGAGISPMKSIFQNDALNTTVFTSNTPEINVTVSLRNQQFTGLNYGGTTAAGFNNAQSTGLVFGIGPATAQDGQVATSGGNPLNRYDFTGIYGGGTGGPQNNMFTTNPTATGAQLGTGMEVRPDIIPRSNGAFQVFTTAQVLFGSATPKDGRVYFGDIVFTFNQPVKNPVLHFAGLGGAYRYAPVGSSTGQASSYLSTFFSTELELVNTGLSSVKMSGNPLFDLSGNNVLNSNNSNPNGGSLDVGVEGMFNNYGAASGSVKLIGTVTEVVYRVYLQGGSASQFAWSTSGSNVINSDREPFTGDIWTASVSLDKPTQQISGNVFNDADGLTDNNINRSATVANPKTNAGGLFANLLNLAGNVVATTSVSPEGVYLFDNVLTGSYTIQLSTISGTIGSAASATQLPAGWVNTGEFGSTTPGNGAGSDGTVDGRSASIVVSSTNIKTEVNFGIERLPESKDFTTGLPARPTIGTILILTPTSTPSLPILSGSDPEDMPIEGVLTGKTLQITTLPTRTTLRYDGVDVIVGQIITNYNPQLLTILITAATAGVSETSFEYAYIDRAGKADLTPARYVIQWQGTTVLPVVLTSFNAVANNCLANITWITSSEINSSRFDVEVSSNNGSSYSKSNTVSATGNSSRGANYNSSYSMQSGVVYLVRLKIIDNDGSFTYSDTRKVSCANGFTKISLAPNPVSTSFILRGMDDGKNQISIYASNGQLMKTQTIVNTQGSVDVSSFASGIYNVRIANQSGTVTTIKMIKN